MKKGLIIINTGNGKGKTTAAFGLALRMVGHGLKTEIIQFIKQRPSGEIAALTKLAPELVRIRQFGNGFTWESKDPAKDRACAQEGWNEAKRVLKSESINLLILDEITYPILDNLISIDEVVTELRGRSPQLHVVLTGRNAPLQLRDAADCVSEINELKHHFSEGVPLQKGIEF